MLRAVVRPEDCMLPNLEIWNTTIRDPYREQTAELPLEEKILTILKGQKEMCRENLVAILAYNGISRNDVFLAIYRLNKESKLSYDALYEIAHYNPELP